MTGGLAYELHGPVDDELEQMAGFWPDINKSRAEAKKLLQEAGAPIRY